ncbi:MAG: pseudouridine synthase [Acidobacteriota bacterium]
MKERVQKIIARAGIASRRKAEELISRGLVTVNGRTITIPGCRADPRRDHVKVKGKLIRPEPLEYYIVNKPRGVLSSVSDPHHNRFVTQLAKSARRLYPAGRLDFQSEGLMILTNDGELTRKLTQGGRLEKKYWVKVQGRPGPRELHRLRQGIRVGGETLTVARIKLLKEGNNRWFEVVLKEGKNRQIRRMFDLLGHRVMRLRRISIGPIALKRLASGASRRLTPGEVESLKRS